LQPANSTKNPTRQTIVRTAIRGPQAIEDLHDIAVVIGKTSSARTRATTEMAVKVKAAVRIILVVPINRDLWTAL